VGWDIRKSSPTVKKQVVKGLLDSGIDVDEIGLVSTPTYYFAVSYFGYDGGIQVSASHNPKEYNGMKLVRARAVPVSGNSGIMDIKKMVLEENFGKISKVKGKLGKREGVLEKELEEQIKYVGAGKIKPFKIVADPANAMAALDLKGLFKKIPCALVKMNFKLDGSFPAHQPNPMVEENLEDLKKRVIKEKADLGIAPDGDGDRYFFVDENGEVVPQAILRGLMAQIELKLHPGAAVAYDIRPGKITRDMIDELGGKPVLTPVGHSLIKELMIKEGAVFGGESSGHYYYKFDYGTFDSPLVLTVKFLQYISKIGKPVSEVLIPFNRYSHSGEINSKLASREAIEEKIEEIKKKYKDGKQVFIDGVSVEYPDVWFNLRASNTEPLIRLTVEGKTQEVMERKRDELLKVIRG